MSEDPYSRLDYRRLIAWPQRIEREWPFLHSLFSATKPRRLLDLGCGTGEHARFLVAQGYEVVGVDVSAEMIEKAREAGPVPGLRFVLGDLADLGELVDGEHGGALCLGNALPHIREPRVLERAFAALRRLLVPGAPFCLQLLSYDRIFTRRERHLPLNFRPQKGEGEEGDGKEGEGEDGWIVFLRLMDPHPDGHVTFNPTTLLYRPGQDPPVEVKASKNVHLYGWRRRELEELLEEAGFTRRELFGGMERQPYVEGESRDLVIVSR